MIQEDLEKIRLQAKEALENAKTSEDINRIRVDILGKKGALTGILDREHVVRVQTPQVFLTEVVKAALTDAVEKGITFTDDATAVERLGMTIQAVEGEEENLKLTTPQDLVIAQGILERRRGAAR